MRALIILAPALLLGACQVTEDKANGSTTVSYNQDVAENAGATALNTVDQAADAIVSDTKEAGAELSGKAKEAGAAVRNVDVDIKVDKDGDAKPAAPANSN